LYKVYQPYLTKSRLEYVYPNTESAPQQLAKTDKRQAIIFENIKQTLDKNTDEDTEMHKPLRQFSTPIEILHFLVGKSSI